MIYAVTAENQHLFGDQLDQMFRHREQRPGFVSAVDEKDDESAVYLIHVDASRRVIESVRLNPVGRLQTDKRWEMSLWPAEPSDQLIEAVAAYCRMNGLTPAEG